MSEKAINRNNVVIGMTMNSVTAFINLFLNQKRKKSENTYLSYAKYCSEFIGFMFGKQIETVTWDDFITITKARVLQYQDFLESKGNGNNTINQKTLAVKTLWVFLREEKQELNEFAFNVEMLQVDKNNPNGYGSFSSDEMNNLIEYCKTHKQKGEIKSLFIETSYVTAIRKECLLSLMWLNFSRETDMNTGSKVWVIKYHDKGKDDATAISDSLANRIFALKKENSLPTDRVFSLNSDTVADMISDFCMHYSLPESRNLTVHSIKKSSGDRIQLMYKDINMTAKHLHHNNIQTAYNNYLGKNGGYTSQPSYSAFDETFSMDEIRTFSHDELISAIENLGKDVITQIIMMKRRDVK